MKRFYKTVSAEKHHDRYIITLDGRPVKTPGKKNLSTQHAALADAIITEWDAQEQEISPRTMPLTGLLNMQIDKVEDEAIRRQIEGELLAYINSDLICYYAEGPDSLVARQRAAWGPLQQTFEEEAGIRLNTTAGLRFVEQDPALRLYGEKFLREIDSNHFTAFQAVIGPLGSFFIAKAFVLGHMTAHEAFETALIEELHQAEIWGADEEAEKNHARLKAELEMIENYVRLTAGRISGA